MGLLDDAIRDHLDLKRRRGADPAEIERAEREALGPVRREPPPIELTSESLDEAGAPTSLDLPLERATTEAELQHNELLNDDAFDLDEPGLLEEHPASGEYLTEEEHLVTDDERFVVSEQAEPPPIEHPAEQPRPRRRLFGRRSARETSEPAKEAEPLPPSEFDDDDPFLHDHGAAESFESTDGSEDIAADDRAGEITRVQRASQFAEPPGHVEPQDPSDRTVEYDVDRDMRDDEPEETATSETQAPGAPTPLTEDPDTESPRTAGTQSTREEGEDVLEETPDFLQDTPDHDRLWFEQKPPRDFDFDG